MKSAFAGWWAAAGGSDGQVGGEIGQAAAVAVGDVLDADVDGGDAGFIPMVHLDFQDFAEAVGIGAEFGQFGADLAVGFGVFRDDLQELGGHPFDHADGPGHEGDDDAAEGIHDSEEKADVFGFHAIRGE